MSRCLPHVHGDSGDLRGQQVPPRKVISLLLYGGDDCGPPRELVSGDLESWAHREHARLAQLAEVAANDSVYRPRG